MCLLYLLSSHPAPLVPPLPLPHSNLTHPYPVLLFCFLLTLTSLHLVGHSRCYHRQHQHHDPHSYHQTVPITKLVFVAVLPAPR